MELGLSIGAIITAAAALALAAGRQRKALRREEAAARLAQLERENREEGLRQQRAWLDFLERERRQFAAIADYDGRPQQKEDENG